MRSLTFPARLGCLSNDFSPKIAPMRVSCLLQLYMCFGSIYPVMSWHAIAKEISRQKFIYHLRWIYFSG